MLEGEGSRVRPLAASVMLSAAVLATGCSADKANTRSEDPSAARSTPQQEAAAAKLSIDDAVLSDEALVSAWPAYGGTHFERRYSPLADIDVTNVARLKVDWYLDLPRDVGLVSTPLVVDGVMYFTGTMNVVRAVDAVTGKLLWEFDPEVGKAIASKRQPGFISSRGISFYRTYLKIISCVVSG